MRALGFVLGTLAVLFWIVFGMRLFIRQSHVTRERLRTDARKARALLGGFRLVRALLAYLRPRPDFHPREAGSLDLALGRLRAEGLDMV